MSRNAVQAGVLVVVLGALGAFLFRAPLGISGWFGGSGDADGSTAPSELGVDEKGDAGRDGAAGKDGDGRADDRTRLAGRHLERRGVGGLSLRVVRAGSSGAIEGATVLVSGTGHGGEDVRATAISDVTGDVRLSSLPAGQGYLVQVTFASEPPILRPDVEIRAGRDRDLGTIEVGATQPLTGLVTDEAGRPIAGADVRVLAGVENLLELMSNMAELFGTLGREPTPLARGKSGDDGRFLLEGLPSGALAIAASTAGRRQSVVQVRMTPRGPTGGEVTIVLEAGVVVAGVVVDASGAPVVGATLALLATRDEDPASFLNERTFTTSDAEGRFRARIDPEAREVRAIVEARGFPTTFSAALKPGKEDARIVLVGGATVEVRVEDAGRHGIDGAQVAIGISRGSGMSDPESDGGFLYGSSDASGLVTFASGPGKVQMVIVSHRDYSSVMVSPNEAALMSAAAGSDLPAEVKADGVTKMVFRLHRALRIRGRILDSQGRPLAGAEVRATAGFMGFGLGPPSRSGADGTYSVTGGSMPGPSVVDESKGKDDSERIGVLVTAAGWHQRAESRSVDGSKAVNGEIVHDVRMVAAATVRGRVVDHEGKAVEGAEVSLAGGDAVSDFMLGRIAAGTHTTGADGTYEIQDAVPDEENAPAPPPFSASSPGGEDGEIVDVSGNERTYVSVEREGVLPGRSEPFRVAPGSTVDVPVIRLSPGAVVRVRVVAPDGRPVAGATVDVAMDATVHDMSDFFAPSKKPTKRTDADGAFTARGVPKGKGSVTARAKGLASARRAIEIGDVDPALVEIRLGEVGELKGRVIHEDGRPVKGASVRVEANADSEEPPIDAGTSTTDEDGRFSLSGLPRGPVTLRVSGEALKSRTFTATVAGDAGEIRVESRGAGDAKRLAEIDAELQQIFKGFVAATAEERQVLSGRMTALQAEKRALEAASNEDPK